MAQQCDRNTRRNNLRFLHGTATCINNILPDSNCKVVKCMVFYLDTKLWAGHQNGGRNRERKCRIPRILSPPALCSKAIRLQKGGVFAGHYRYVVSLHAQSCVKRNKLQAYMKPISTHVPFHLFQSSLHK